MRDGEWEALFGRISALIAEIRIATAQTNSIIRKCYSRPQLFVLPSRRAENMTERLKVDELQFRLRQLKFASGKSPADVD
jgi:hypothetical protein